MKRSLLFALALGIFTPGLAFADHHEEAGAEEAPATEAASDEKVHSANFNVLGPLYSSYTFNYVYLLEGTHGFLVEPGLQLNSNAKSDYMTYGSTVGYRWHWDGVQDSGFLGVNIGYYVGSGTVAVSDATLGTVKDFELTITQFSMIPNIGWRWAWDGGFNITFRMGIGYGDYGAETDSSDVNAQKAVKTMDDFLNLIPVAFDGELSAGWCF